MNINTYPKPAGIDIVPTIHGILQIKQNKCRHQSRQKHMFNTTILLNEDIVSIQCPPQKIFKALFASNNVAKI